jgi:hypothetical protein
MQTWPYLAVPNHEADRGAVEARAEERRNEIDVLVTRYTKDSPPHYGLLLRVHTFANRRNRAGCPCINAYIRKWGACTFVRGDGGCATGGRFILNRLNCRHALLHSWP